MLVRAGTKAQRGVQLEITSKFDLRKMACKGLKPLTHDMTWNDAKQVWVVTQYRAPGGEYETYGVCYRNDKEFKFTYEMPASSRFPIPTKLTTAKPLLSF
jgi:hypothetical protein